MCVLEPGLLTTIQDHGRLGWRHMGVPYSGYADPLSAAIANHLLDNAFAMPLLEITMVGGEFEFMEPNSFALAGAVAESTVNNQPIDFYKSYKANAGDKLRIGPIEKGLRCYLSVAGGFDVDKVFNSASTTLSANFGGHEGRAVRCGDVLAFSKSRNIDHHVCPMEYRPRMSNGYILRVTKGPDFSLLSKDAQHSFLTQPFTASVRADRMGIALEKNPLEISTQEINSAAVFPGTVQCPPGGEPFLLGVDSQTTGGYPHIAQVIRADLHLMGQIRPHDSVRFIEVSTQLAQDILMQKTFLYEQYLPHAPF